MDKIINVRTYFDEKFVMQKNKKKLAKNKNLLYTYDIKQKNIRYVESHIKFNTTLEVWIDQVKIFL